MSLTKGFSWRPLRTILHPYPNPNRRSLAEVYSSLGNAYNYLGDAHSENTVKFRRKAVECLESCLKHTLMEAKQLKKGETDTEGRSHAELQEEAAELGLIIGELKEEVRAFAAGVLARSNGQMGAKRKATEGEETEGGSSKARKKD